MFSPAAAIVRECRNCKLQENLHVVSGPDDQALQERLRIKGLSMHQMCSIVLRFKFQEVTVWVAGAFQY